MDDQTTPNPAEATPSAGEQEKPVEQEPATPPAEETPPVQEPAKAEPEVTPEAADKKSATSDLLKKAANQPPTTSEEKIWSLVAYIPFVSIMALIMNPKSDYVKLHSRQALLLLAIILITSLFFVIPFIGPVIVLIVDIGTMIVSLFSMYQAYVGNWWKMPVLGDIAEMIPVDNFTKVTREAAMGSKVDKMKQDQMKKEEESAAPEAAPSETTEAPAPEAASAETTLEEPAETTPEEPAEPEPEAAAEPAAEPEPEAAAPAEEKPEEAPAPAEEPAKAPEESTKTEEGGDAPA